MSKIGVFLALFLASAVYSFAVPPQTVAPTSPQGQHQGGNEEASDSSDQDDESVDDDVIIMEDDDEDEESS